MVNNGLYYDMEELFVFSISEIIIVHNLIDGLIKNYL
jgi:hypothetical protein